MESDKQQEEGQSPQAAPDQKPAWLTRVPWFLHDLALREGQQLFTLAMQAGAATEAANILAKQARGNRAAEGATAVLVTVCNWLVGALLAQIGKKPGDIARVQGEIGQLSTLANAQEGPTSPGGIILKG